MREHLVNSENNFICGWYLENTSVCDEMIDLHKKSKTKLPGSFLISNMTTVDKTIKDSVDITLTIDSNIGFIYAQNLQYCVDKYIQKYPWCNKYARWNIIEPINIQYYPPAGGFHIFHTERMAGTFPISGRHLVFMTYLNDVTDDGETEFLHQQLKIKPEKGLTLIWPADWTFTHRGVASLTQEKYITTGWFNYHP
jgi:hypothetical protein